MCRGTIIGRHLANCPRASLQLTQSPTPLPLILFLCGGEGIEEKGEMQPLASS